MMKRILGVSVFALFLVACEPPPAVQHVRPQSARVMIGTPTKSAVTPALQALEQGGQDRQVLVRFTVQPDGSVANAAIRYSKLSPADTDIVLTAVQSWYFKPARENGKPVARDFIYPLFFGPHADTQRTVFMCRNQSSIYEPDRHCSIVISGDWRIYQFDPIYPSGLLDRRLSGSVTLGFDIGPEGRAVNPKVVTADPPDLFDAAAIAAVKQWYFERLDGKAVTQGESHQHVTVSVHFVPPPAAPSGTP